MPRRSRRCRSCGRQLPRLVRWPDPRGDTRSGRPPASHTRLGTTAWRAARLPVSAQSKVRLLETRNTQLCGSQEGRQPLEPARSGESGIFPHVYPLPSHNCGISPPAAENFRNASSSPGRLDDERPTKRSEQHIERAGITLPFASIQFNARGVSRIGRASTSDQRC